MIHWQIEISLMQLVSIRQNVILSICSFKDIIWQLGRTEISYAIAQSQISIHQHLGLAQQLGSSRAFD